MAQIDTSKIEGYENMTAEEKVKAFESFNIPDPDYSGYVKKEVFDKKASEAAKLEKDLKARMTEEERAKAERDAELAEYKTKYEELQKEKNIAANKAQFIAAGYDEALATESAEALEKGDFATVFKNQNAVIERVKKDALGQAKASTPPPAGKATDGDKTVTREQFNAMSLAERQALYESNRELYDEFTK